MIVNSVSLNVALLTILFALTGFVLILTALRMNIDMKPIQNKAVSALCWLMSILPFSAWLTRDDWRDLAKLLNGEPLPEERKNYLKAKVKDAL